MQNTWIILGATSSMARPFIRRLADQGDALVLAGRDMDDMSATAQDCLARGARDAQVVAVDMRAPETFGGVIATALGLGGTLNVAVFVGSMPEQDAINADPTLTDGVIADSLTGPARFLQAIAPEFETQEGGTIVGVSSVAGDRGRIANYVYGAAKGGFTVFLSGLRNRLGRKGAHVVTVKPGPVDSAMTWGLGKMPFMTTPEAVCDDIFKAIRKKRNVIYTAGIWRLVMMVIRIIPEPIFKKMNF